MSTFAELAVKPFSKKILLGELDIGTVSKFASNWAAGIWYEDMDAIYSRIDPSLLDGVSANNINSIGSIYANGTLLLKVNSLADVFANAQSFYWDNADRRVYYRLPNYDSPELYDIVYGVVVKVANIAGVYGGELYESRLISVPKISKSKDPLFFGKISFDGGRVEHLNEDGEYDLHGEDQDIFGNPYRLELGFDDLERAKYKKLYEGFVETCEISETRFGLDIADKRKQLSRKLPTAVFDDTTYPDIKPSNVGKSIPAGWGPINNAPVICTNEKESGTPPWEFKICDCTYHAIKAITTVYVEDVAKTPASTDLTKGEFVLNTGDYSPGDKVTVTYEGYKDDSGDLIKNGMDEIKDILLSYYPISFNNYYFNVDEWNSFQGQAADIGIFISKPTETWKIIEQISYSLAGNWQIQDDGLQTFRIYNSARSTVQTIYYHELLEDLILNVKYEPQEVLTSCRIGFNKDWAEDEYTYYLNDDSEAQNYLKYKTYRDKTFDTLLTSKAAAQAYAGTIMSLAGTVKKPVEVKTKMQSIDREIGDMIKVQYKTKTRAFIGWVKCEVIRKVPDLDKMEVNMTCRIVERTEADPSRILKNLSKLYNTAGKIYNSRGRLHGKTTYGS